MFNPSGRGNPRVFFPSIIYYEKLAMVYVLIYHSPRKQLGRSNIAILLGVFNKTINPLALVEYEIVIANSYPTRARGIIVNYLRRSMLTIQRFFISC